MTESTFTSVAERRPGQALPKNLFLEASAGTGKTYSIQHYLVRSILEAGNDILLPAQVLIVTFTNAAAHELKLRIQETLEHAAAALLQMAAEAEDLPEIDFTAICRYCTDRGLGYLASFFFTEVESGRPISLSSLKTRSGLLCYKLKRFVRDLDLCEITTIHSFFHRLLNQFYREAATASDLREGSAVESAAVHGSWIRDSELMRWIQDSLVWSAPEGLIAAEEWNLLINSFSKSADPSSALLYDLAHRLLDSKGAPRSVYSASNPMQEREAKWALVQKVWSGPSSLRQEDRLEIFEAWIAQKKGSSRRDGRLKPDVQNALRALGALLNEKNYSLAVHGEMASIFAELDAVVMGEKKKRAAALERGCDMEAAESFILKLWSELRALASLEALYEGVFQYLEVRFFERLQKGEWKTPDSILKEAAAISSSPRFCAYVQQRFRLAVVDEFQDTDPLQWNLFQALFLSGANRVLLVGDPKQAIYFFRKADVYTYLQARQQFAPHEITSLGDNYRASAGMVSALNALFSEDHVDRWLFYMPKVEKSLECRPLVPRSKEIPYGSHRAGVSIHFALGTGIKGRKKTWPTDEVEQETLFPWIVREIRALQAEEGNISLSDIAILVQDRYQAKRVGDFLYRAGLLSKTVRVDDITESPLFTILIAFLQAVDRPSSESALYQILLALGTEKSVQAARAIPSNLSILQQPVEFFSSAQRAFYLDGVGKMAHILLHDLFLCDATVWGWIEDALGCDIQHQIDAEHFFEIASQLKALGYGTISHMVQAFFQLPLVFADNRDFIVRRVQRSERAIQIMTMHRSKGLEFSTVFSIGASTRAKEADEEEPESLPHYRVYDHESEKIRLLYVALTRAKKRLYIPYIAEGSKNEPKAGSLSPLELFFSSHRAHNEGAPLRGRDDWMAQMRRRPVDEAEARSIVEGLQERAGVEKISVRSMAEELAEPARPSAPGLAEARSPDADIAAAPLFFQKAKMRQVVSFSKLQRESKGAPQLLFGRGPVRKHGARFGSRFHIAISLLLREPQLCKIDCFEWLAARFPLWKEDAEELALLLGAVLDAKIPFDEKKSSLRMLQDTASYSTEQYFLDKVSDAAFLQGAIDLLIIHDMRLYLLDWKTSKEAAHMIESQYHIQAALYSQSAMKYLRGVHTPIQFGGAYVLFVEALAQRSAESTAGLFYSKDAEVRRLRVDGAERILSIGEALL